MSRFIKALLFRIGYKHYSRYLSSRIVTGKEITPVVYRPKKK